MILIKTIFLPVFIILSSFSILTGQTKNPADLRELREKEPTLSIEFQRTIGELDSDNEQEIFYLPEGLAFDNDDNIYVLDAGNYRVQKFNKDMEYVATIGRKGRGPGELINPLSMAIDKDKKIYILDEGNRRIQVFDQFGKSHKTIPIEENFKYGVMKFFDNGSYVVGGGGFFMSMGIMFAENPIPEKQIQNLLTVIDNKGKITNNYVPASDFGDALINRTVNDIHYFVDDDHNIYINYDYQNKTEKYSKSGTKILDFSRELNYPLTKPKTTKDSIKRKGNSTAMRMPKLNQTSSGIAVDHKGRIWSATFDRQVNKDEFVGLNYNVNSDGSGNRDVTRSVNGATDVYKTNAFVLEVFSPSGKLLQKLPIEHFADNIIIESDYIYILDKFRAGLYYKYKIIEN